ncbi:MAG TPA: Imm45 family immunity protein [Rhizobiaceae bacterium]|nr:Imm45 family immunity protein [Rhizobiaceae bacterium]
MNFIRLSELDGSEPLFRGSILRFRKFAPREEIVDYMLFETSEGSGLGLIRDSGYGAGHVLVILPLEARFDSKVTAISPAWLKNHWQEWVDNHSVPHDVWVLKEGRAAPEKLPEE